MSQQELTEIPDEVVEGSFLAEVGPEKRLYFREEHRLVISEEEVCLR